MNANKMKLRHLNCFLEVARQKSVVRAAEQLNMTQPAVSRAIRELEELLGTQLFDRSRRGARLTDAGEIFHRHATAAMAQVAQGISMLQAAGPGEVLAIGALPNVGVRFLPAVLDRFKQEHPNVTVRVVTGPNADLLTPLRHAELAFVVGRLASSDFMRGLTFELLYMEPLVFVTRPGHPLAQKGAAALADVAGFTVVLPQPGTIIRSEADRFLAAQGITAFPNVVETGKSEIVR